MSIFNKQDRMAEDLLQNYRGKVLAIVKATRAGATFSLLKRACELKQKTVIVAPYIEIFNKTVKEVEESFSKNKPKIARIPRNEDICTKLAERIKDNPQLKKLSFHFRPSCVRCEYNNPEHCRLQEILASDWNVLGLTYAKLRALSVSESATAMDLLEKIEFPDNLILDEFVTGLIVASPSVAVEEPHAYLQKEFSYETRALKSFGERSIDSMFWYLIANFAIYAEVIGKNLKEREFIIYDNPVKNDCGTFFQDNFSKCWKLIERLAIEEKNTRMLEQLLQIVVSNRFFILKKKGEVSIKPLFDIDDVSRGSLYLRNFAKSFFKENKLVALVDACLPDLDLNHSLGLDVKTFSWGDPLNTNQSQLIICDTRKIGETDFFKSMKLQAELKKTITTLSGLHGANTILLATQNKKMWEVIEVWRKIGTIPKDIMTTYYRSDISRGVTSDPMRRVLILTGAPYLPKEAYLPETYISVGQATDLQTAYKKSDMKSTFINLIGRVKDPEGKENSIVYALGIRADETRAFLAQEKVIPPFAVKFPVQGVDSEDFMRAAHLFLNVKKDRWKKIEDDLPVLERAIRKCHEHEKVNCGDIVPNQTEKVQRIVEDYRDVLELYNIKVVTGARGSSLVLSKS